MSHQATNWAILQRGLKPAAKLVLWHLCDRFHPDNGCFPSQETLAGDCELSRSSLNDQLDTLEKAGLIARERRRQKGSQKMEQTRYRLAFEAGFTPVAAENPCPEFGQGSEAEAVSENDGEPSPKNGENHVRNSDSNPVREPVREPVNERERGREPDEGEDRPGTAAFQKRVQRFVAGIGFSEGEWPKWAKSTLDYIVRQFAGLSEVDRRQAEANRDAFLAKCRRENTSPMPVGNFLRDKAWTLLSEADRKWAASLAARREGGKDGPAKPEGWATAYGPAHSAELFRILLAGPQNPAAAPSGGVWLANHIRTAWPRLFAFRQQTAIHGGLKLSRDDSGLMEFVPSDSPVMTDLHAEFRRRGWPDLVVADGMRGHYVPKGGVDGIEDFRRRVEGEQHAEAE